MYQIWTLHPHPVQSYSLVSEFTNYQLVGLKCTPDSINLSYTIIIVSYTYHRSIAFNYLKLSHVKLTKISGHCLYFYTIERAHLGSCIISLHFIHSQLTVLKENDDKVLIW